MKKVTEYYEVFITGEGQNAIVSKWCTFSQATNYCRKNHIKFPNMTMHIRKCKFIINIDTGNINIFKEYNNVYNFIPSKDN